MTPSSPPLHTRVRLLEPSSPPLCARVCTRNLSHRSFMQEFTHAAFVATAALSCVGSVWPFYLGILEQHSQMRAWLERDAKSDMCLHSPTRAILWLVGASILCIPRRYRYARGHSSESLVGPIAPEVLRNLRDTLRVRYLPKCFESANLKHLYKL